MDERKQKALAQLIYQRVIDGKLPRYLYKYRVINKFFDDIVMNNRLWFSNPLDFNDPFDCNITFQSNNSFEEIRKYISQHSPYQIEDKILDRISRMLFENPEAL
jgi:hypothetical protein